MTQKSEIIVLIPHFNDPEGLAESLTSIREQINVDVLVVDDGSSQPPEEERLRAIYTTGRLHLLKLMQNQGIEHALNAGLKHIMELGYTYIARLDCGDTNLAKRFSTQLEFMKQNPQVQLLGTQVNYIDEHKQFMYTSNFPLNYNSLKKQMFVNCMLVHPTVIFRSALIKEVGLYPTSYKAAEDYAFFMKIIQEHEAQNLPGVWVEKEIDDNSISAVKYKLQVRNRIRIILKYFHFAPYPIYGLIRNCILYLFPRKFIGRIKMLKSKM